MGRVLCVAWAGVLLAQANTASGTLKFSDVSEAAGIADVAVNSTGPAFGDYDNDGDMDVYVPT